MLQWQKQHQCDLKMLAAKEEQLRSFQEEMATLKENLLADEKDVGAPRLLVTSSHFLPALPTATWLPYSPWWGWRCLGARKDTCSIQHKAGSGCRSVCVDLTIFPWLC